jgi:multidrug efflux system outer membrane protein
MRTCNPSNLDLLSAEQSLVTAAAQVAASDAAVVQNEVSIFKALGGGWNGNGR